MDAREKRKRVMARSIKLGHCVCDPRKPCPCPLFKEKNVCTCAGESVPLESPEAGVRLTEFVRSGGCAGKISQKDLHEVLDRLPVVEDPRLVVGMATADDAGVFRITPDLTVVQTVDVFTPNVDDPYLFGRIAGCNSLSDVYAMGGTPVTALSIIGFPIRSLPHAVMAEILRGGMDVLKEAGAVLLGGHSLDDEEVKFGFAVTGIIRSVDLVSNSGARPGDRLILTKPLGTGIVSLAHQIDRASAEAIAAIGESMGRLNKTAAAIMVQRGARACTDVTGFGLVGHLCRMVMESEVTAEVWCDRLPFFPGVLEYAEQGIFSGANERNAEFSAERTRLDADVPEAVRAVLFDAQTSGGLLIAVPEDEARRTVDEMRAAGVEHAEIIGRIAEESDGRIEVLATSGREGGGRRQSGGTAEAKVMSSGKVDKPEEHAEECCAGSAPAGGSAVEMFQQFLAKSVQPGAVDVVTKELIAVALGLAVNCVPCSRIHIKKALGMGVGKEELDEVAALAMGFGGCRAMMLWNDMKKEFLHQHGA